LAFGIEEWQKMLHKPLIEGGPVVFDQNLIQLIFIFLWLGTVLVLLCAEGLLTCVYKK
jgi:hypothetical protein